VFVFIKGNDNQKKCMCIFSFVSFNAINDTLKFTAIVSFESIQLRIVSVFSYCLHVS